MRSKNLTEILYCYVEKDNEKHARTVGKKLFGSHSAYVNALIARDRGVTPNLGSWKAPGEADTLRKQKRKKAKPMSKKKTAPRIKKLIKETVKLSEKLTEPRTVPIVGEVHKLEPQLKDDYEVYE